MQIKLKWLASTIRNYEETSGGGETEAEIYYANRIHFQHSISLLENLEVEISVYS